METVSSLWRLSSALGTSSLWWEGFTATVALGNKPMPIATAAVNPVAVGIGLLMYIDIVGE